MSAFSAEEAAVQYEEWDPNSETRNAIAELRRNKNTEELGKILSTRLQFGTAGLRGPMGAGYNRMNDLVVLQTTQGLVRYLESVNPNAKEQGVVIGHDHRATGTLSSQGFARISAAVFLSQGFKVYCLEGNVPTPFVAFGVTYLGCAAGIMVTASHNPKQDDGFKVYWDTGSQIIPPHDTGIASAIDANLQPWQAYDTAGVLSHALASDSTADVADAYYSSIQSLSTASPAQNSASEVKAVYTAMHGVGCQWVRRAFSVFGHPALDAVPSQAEPDPTFPTVKFPNPEEKGALDESIKYAESRGATLIIANDPDADRLAVAEKASTDGSWYVFSGNELGVLLGHWQMMQWNAASTSTSTGTKKAAVLASIVSSRMLSAIAMREGFVYQDTLTGFKWLGDCALRLRAAGTPVIFLYEEALGYCIGNNACDKDGVSAASVFLEMATQLRSQQQQQSQQSQQSLTVKQHLQSLYTKYGEFVSYNSYVLSHVAATTAAIFQRLRSCGPAGDSNSNNSSSSTNSSGSGSNGEYWSECVGVRITAVKDITMGYDSSTPDHKSLLPTTPGSEMIMFEFENGVSVTLRTSGTEPKIKFYTEIAGKPGQARAEVDAILHSFVDALVDEMLQPEKNDLIRA